MGQWVTPFLEVATTMIYTAHCRVTPAWASRVWRQKLCMRSRLNMIQFSMRASIAYPELIRCMELHPKFMLPLGVEGLSNVIVSQLPRATLEMDISPAH